MIPLLSMELIERQAKDYQHQKKILQGTWENGHGIYVMFGHAEGVIVEVPYGDQVDVGSWDKSN